MKSLVASGHVSDGPGLGPEMQLAPCLSCQALPVICSRVLSHGSRSSQKIRITALRYIHLHHIEDRSYYAISGFRIPPSSSYIDKSNHRD